MLTPKVFISYSWTSQGHQSAVKQWAERLLADGVDVVLDIFDLKEGHDKYAFMERMVVDPTVTHVLMMCDHSYATKADGRKAGVGTESQIISKEVYEKTEQSKFLPIICELDEQGNPFLPVFLKSRMWIDFSSAEAVNENWEQLIRVLHGKPLHVKPAVGKPPSYLHDDAAPASPTISKFAALRHAVLAGKPSIDLYRQDFLDACFQYADLFRVKVPPDAASLGNRILTDCEKLKLIRNQIVDWVLLEAPITANVKFGDVLHRFLERLLELKARPETMAMWNDTWFEAHGVFVYETFLYIVAALLKVDAYSTLHSIFTTRYMQPRGVRHFEEGELASFDCFWAFSKMLQVLAPEGKQLLSPAAELIKRQADRVDIPFQSVLEAELLVLLMAYLTPAVAYWYPGTLIYSTQNVYPFFKRATQKKGFSKLAVVTGINDATALRAAALTGMQRLGVQEWHDFRFRDRSFADAMNLKELDSLA